MNSDNRLLNTASQLICESHVINGLVEIGNKCFIKVGLHKLVNR